MGVLMRLYEKMTGRPHQHRHAKAAVEAHEDLRREVGELHEALQPYVDTDDPLVALMTDMFNNRQLRGRREE